MQKKFENLEQEIIFNRMLLHKKQHEDSLRVFNFGDTLTEVIKKDLFDLKAHAKNTSIRKISSSKKPAFLAKIIILMKRIIRKVVFWYVEPVAEQQTLYNNVNYKFHLDVLNILDAQQEKISNLEKTIDNLKKQKGTE